ncbi:MAG: exopolysaccharide biosynthesis polyprenyl glycosylphosphotransferase [Caldilineaceae bacterium]
MNLLVLITYVLLWLIGTLLAGMVGYLLLLTGAAWFAPKRTLLPKTPTQRFALLIPAHNEEKLLPLLLQNLAQLTYPRHLYSVHVVADNCTDRTAELTLAAGATVHERFNTTEKGKGYALQWLFQQLEEQKESYDAAVILDADSLLSPNFLTVMDAKLAAGAQAVQAYYAVRDPGRTWAVGLRAMALAVIHYLRPQGRMVLGGSAGLKGNGMVLHRSLLRQHVWSAAVTEDIEYHMALLLTGERVFFAPDAIVWAEMPGALRTAHSQNVRWEQGRLQMARHYIPRLLRAVWIALRGTQGSGSTSPAAGRSRWREAYLYVDAIMEHLILPFSLLTSFSLLFGVAVLLVGTPKLVWLALFILAGQVLYLAAGLILTQAPMRLYMQLVYAPLFMIWKVWLYVRLLLQREQQGWVRTARDGAAEVPPQPVPGTATIKTAKVLERLAQGRYESPQLAWRLRWRLVLWALRVRIVGYGKRMLDITMASVALLLLWPLMLVTAVAIKFESPGPVIFQQKRIGKWGRPFTCYKFRSMCVDAEQRKSELLHRNEVDGPIFKMQRDPRITRVGAFIRKTSIDELPQLFNILRGDMSLVGPRPPVPQEVDQYHFEQLRRLNAVPGLTGLQQVSGRSDLSFERWVELDLEYIADQSLRHDIKILLKTIPTVLLGRGAY